MKDNQRYQFGKNWTLFLKVLNNERIKEAEKSLIDYIGKANFNGLSFLDIGCGSGLFSLCAKNLGATVHSFDYDINSVNCTKELQKKYFPESQDNNTWIIEQGNVLDSSYMKKFVNFDIVYSWGVLHHTGNMNVSFDLIANTVKINGLLFIAIYNDKGLISKFWKKIKRGYNLTPRIFRFIYIIPYICIYWIKEIIYNIITNKNPFYSFLVYKRKRGMSIIYDMYDWLGGYPYETASCSEILDIFKNKGFELIKLKDTNGTGCNQFMFKRVINEI